MVRTYRAGKGPGRYWGWSLSSTEQKGPWHASHLRERGTPPGSLAGFLGLSGRVYAFHSSPAPLVLEGLSHLRSPPNLLFSPSFLSMPPGPTGPGGGFGGWGTRHGSSAGFPGQSGWGQCLPLLSRSFGPGGPLLPASPVLPWPASLPLGPTWPRGSL